MREQEVRASQPDQDEHDWRLNKTKKHSTYTPPYLLHNEEQFDVSKNET